MKLLKRNIKVFTNSKNIPNGGWWMIIIGNEKKSHGEFLLTILVIQSTLNFHTDMIKSNIWKLSIETYLYDFVCIINLELISRPFSISYYYYWETFSDTNWICITTILVLNVRHNTNRWKYYCLSRGHILLASEECRLKL